MAKTIATRALMAAVGLFAMTLTGCAVLGGAAVGAGAGAAVAAGTGNNPGKGAAIGAGVGAAAGGLYHITR
jgi:hypothetical protein